MNRIPQMVDDYLANMHSLGYLIVAEGKALKKFSTFIQGNGYSGSLKIEVVNRWLDTFDDISASYRSRLYETVRAFSHYASTMDKGSVWLPKGDGRCHNRATPYIYTDGEITIMMDILETIYSPDGLRALSITAAVGLLWATGLRPAECTKLANADYNSTSSVLSVRATKFNKSRNVPLSDSAAYHLEQYITKRDSFMQANVSSLFCTTGGKPLNYACLSYAWKTNRAVLLPDGQKAWECRAPRLMDIRHTFATRTLERWHHEGRDLNAMMPYLSAYLGHVKIKDTYWYLTGTPELLGIASRKFAGYVGDDTL